MSTGAPGSPRWFTSWVLDATALNTWFSRYALCVLINRNRKRRSRQAAIQTCRPDDNAVYNNCHDDVVPS